MAYRQVLCTPGQLEGIGLTSTSAPPSNVFSDTNPPWRPGPGENILDNMPTGVTIVNASDLTSSRDLRTIMQAAENTSIPTQHCYIKYDSGKYFWNRMYDYGSAGNSTTAPAPNFIGYANGNRKIQGHIGAGFSSLTGEFLTQWVISPTFVSSTPATPTSWPGGSKTPAEIVTTAVPGTGITLPGITALYMSNTSSTKPFFFSAISFDGQMQGPYQVYSAGSQAAADRNLTVPSPLAYQGISLVRGAAGSRFQFCRFRGCGFAINSAPPFECGAINTNYCNMVVYRVEVDGRVAAEFDATRPRASGGWMWNKEIYGKMWHVWIHHTRRSGLAQNTNTHDINEVYELVDVQQDNIANVGTDDPYIIEVTNPQGFNTPNMEGMVGTFNMTNWRANSAHSHIALTIPGGYVLPSRALIHSDNFSTDDSKWNGCLRLSTGSVGGASPVWQALNSNFAASCALYFDIKFAGVPLTPVKGSLFNAGTMGPTTHYVLGSF